MTLKRGRDRTPRRRSPNVGPKMLFLRIFETAARSNLIRVTRHSNASGTGLGSAAHGNVDNCASCATLVVCPHGTASGADPQKQQKRINAPEFIMGRRRLTTWTAAPLGADASDTHKAAGVHHIMSKAPSSRCSFPARSTTTLGGPARHCHVRESILSAVPPPPLFPGGALVGRGGRENGTPIWRLPRSKTAHAPNFAKREAWGIRGVKC